MLFFILYIPGKKQYTFPKQPAKEETAMSLHFRKWDIAMIAAVLLLAVFVLLLFLPKAENGAYAEVYQDGKLLFTVSLEEVEGLLGCA